jgi:uncharacterized protein YprB with RNaseH-like and TPR domain
VNLRDKLARLPPPKAAPAPAATAERADVLEALRRKMSEILQRPLAPRRAPADPSRTELPFVREDDAQGPVYRRFERLLPSHHVGRMPLDAAASAASEVLALLALDPSLAACDVRGALFLDTETTGLGGGAGILAFLVGMAFFEGDRLCLEQLLLRSPAEEPALLARVLQRVESASLLVTYNGKAFDWPLLNGRQLMNRLPPLPARPHLDLLHVGRRLHRARLGACKLTTLESDVLGFVRGPDIDGGDIAARYGHFLRSGDEEALRGVVEHNAIDVMSMAALMALYGEPLGTLHDSDLIGLARTFKRAGALERADEAAHAAVERGAGPDALRMRAQIAKARGDRVRALSDFEALSAELGDSELYLELAKLYEHHVKQPLKALEFVELGTGESVEALERRRARLRRKAERPPKSPRRKRGGSA